MPDKDRFRYLRIDSSRLTIERRGLADAVARVAEGPASGFSYEIIHCGQVIEDRGGPALGVEKAVTFAEDALDRLWQEAVLSQEMTYDLSHVDAFFLEHGLD